MAYEVSTPVYQGPFDLLLHLILKEEVELWEVSLAQVIDAFLIEVDRLDRLDLDVATEFLLIASTLVELKARRLLPGADMTELDEELLRFEERDLLLARLLECKTFKDAAAVLEGHLRVGSRSVPRTAGPEEPFRSMAPDPLERVTLKSLQAAAERGLAPKVEEIIDTFHLAPIRASVRVVPIRAACRRADTHAHSLLRRQDSNLNYLNQNQRCCRLHHDGLRR